MLSAVENVVHQIQEVTGIGKDEHREGQDVQQQVDQAPAGSGEEAETTPEFTTTSKQTRPSGEKAVMTTKDDVPISSGDDTADEPNPQAPQPTSSTKSQTADSPAGPMNAMANMGAGSVGLPKTCCAWKTQHDMWYPDAGGMLHPPNFHINKRRNQGWAL